VNEPGRPAVAGAPRRPPGQRSPSSVRRQAERDRGDLRAAERDEIGEQRIADVVARIAIESRP